jgi:hypothetical protein
MMDTAAGGGFSADSIRAYMARKREATAAEQRAHEAAVKAEREKLHQEFLERQVKPEALERVAALVRKAVDAGEKQALVFQFPSDWLPDQGRAITNRERNWHEKLDGFARRAYEYYERELAPRGFQLRAEILDWPGGMPGTVGFILQWKRPEEL